MPLLTRRRLLAGFASLGAIAGVFGLRSATARHFHGWCRIISTARFFDRNGVPAKSVPKALYDQWSGIVRGPAEMARMGAELLRRPAARARRWRWQRRISYVGHASFLLQTAGLDILIDPVPRSASRR